MLLVTTYVISRYAIFGVLINILPNITRDTVANIVGDTPASIIRDTFADIYCQRYCS